MDTQFIINKLRDVLTLPVIDSMKSIPSEAPEFCFVSEPGPVRWSENTLNGDTKIGHLSLTVYHMLRKDADASALSADNERSVDIVEAMSTLDGNPSLNRTSTDSLFSGYYSIAYTYTFTVSLQV